MELSLFLAQAWGALLVVLCGAMLVRKENFDRILRVMNHEGTAFVAGFVTLMIGILSVLAHNMWVAGWPVIITIFGWSALIKGVILITYPDLTLKTVNKISPTSWWLRPLLILGIIFGGYLFSMGVRYRDILLVLFLKYRYVTQSPLIFPEHVQLYLM